jgi:hypothetical protein
MINVLSIQLIIISGEGFILSELRLLLFISASIALPYRFKLIVALSLKLDILIERSSEYFQI